MKSIKEAAVGGVEVKDIGNPDEVRRRIYDLMDMFSPMIPPLKDGVVMLKINLCLLLGPETGATVDPVTVRHLIDWLLANRPIKEVILAESDATHMSADIAYRALGWDRYFADLKNVRFLNLSTDRTIPVVSHRTYIKNLKMSETYMKCDWLVSVAKLKTHTEQFITCAMKNIFGAIPEKIKFAYHPRLDEAICDANSPRLPDFGFIEGLIAMENDGPTKGTPRKTGLILAGNDIVALDHYAATIMGFNPSRVPHVRLALKRGMGTDRYRVLNSAIKPCDPPFAFMPWWKQAVRWGVGKARRGNAS